MKERDIATYNDNRLKTIVTYAVTEGGTLMVKVTEYYNPFKSKFKEFKTMIKRGTMTIDELEKRVYSQFGIIDQGQVASKPERQPLVRRAIGDIREMLDDMRDTVGNNFNIVRMDSEHLPENLKRHITEYLESIGKTERFYHLNSWNLPQDIMRQLDEFIRKQIDENDDENDNDRGEG